MKQLVDVSTFTAEITVPENSDPRTAESVEAGFQGLANRTKHLRDNTVNGDASNSYAGDLAWSGAHTLTGSLTLSGATASIRYRVDRTTLVDADSIVLTVAADIYIAAAAPTAARTVTLKSTSPAPVEGQVIRVSCPHVGSIGAAEKWIFQREDTTELARIVDTTVITLAGTVGFVFTNGKWVVFEAGPTTTIADHSA